jgi:hypothetical protein
VNASPYRSWAPWVRRRRDSRAEDAEQRRVAERISATVQAQLAEERRAAWWRLAEAHGWNGGRPMASAVPHEDLLRHRRFWNAIGARPHSTEPNA